MPEVTDTNGDTISRTSIGTSAKRHNDTNPTFITKHSIIDNKDIQTVFNHFILYSPQDSYC